jgi:hypothetical protein
MKETTYLILGAALLGACSSTSGDGEVATSSASSTPSVLVVPPDPVRTKAASDVLSRVRDVVATGRVNGIGFSSPADLDVATLGDAIPVYYVSSRAILGRTAGEDPHAVMGKPMEMVYPVLVNGVVKSEVMMGQDETGTWKVSGVGRPQIIQAIDHTTQKLAVGGHAPAVALVEMHDLGVSLLAHEETGAVTFTAYTERDSAGLAVGEDVPAETALQRLAEYAKQRGNRAD